jgi:hypothetical protein
MTQTSVPCPPGTVEDHPVPIHRNEPSRATADPRHVLCSMLADPVKVQDLMAKVKQLSPDFPTVAGSHALFASSALQVAGFPIPLTGGERELIARVTAAGWKLLSARKTEPAAADLFVSLSPQGDVHVLGIVAAVRLPGPGEHHFYAMTPAIAEGAFGEAGRRWQYPTDQPGIAVDFWLRFPCSSCGPPVPRQ